jgi:transposase
MPGVISIKTRWLIVFLYRHWLGPHKSKSYICKKLNVSKDTVDHWVEVYDRTGDVVSEKSDRLKKISGWKESHIISSLVYANPEATLDEIVEAASALGYSLSRTTVWRRLQSMGIKYGTPILKPVLSPAQRNARMKFARMNKSKDWSKVLFY